MDKPAVVTTTLEQVLSQSISEQLDRVTPHKETVGIGLGQWILFGLGISVAIIIMVLSLVVVYLSQTSQRMTVVQRDENTLLQEAYVLPEIPNRAGITIELVNGSSEKIAALEELGYQVIVPQKPLKTAQKISTLMVQPSLASNSGYIKEDVARLFGIASASADLKDSTASARVILGN